MGQQHVVVVVIVVVADVVVVVVVINPLLGPLAAAASSLPSFTGLYGLQNFFFFSPRVVSLYLFFVFVLFYFVCRILLASYNMRTIYHSCFYIL